MKTYLPKNARFVALSLASVLMIACGDSSSLQSSNAQLSESPVATSASEISVSATTSAAGAFGFVNMMANSQNDRAEPLVGGTAVLATSETDEPSV